jgi:hypothetical protein
LILIWAALLDLFLNVLYARAGSGYISDRVARLTWNVFVAVSRMFGRHRPKLLSLGGPAILVMLVATWALILTIGSALVMHPYLGTAIKANSGQTQTNFLVALYAGGSSMSLVGSSDYSPKTTLFRMVFLFNSIVGMSVMSLALTYIMQVYNALQRRNAFALELDLMTDCTGDAVALIKGIGPRGKFEAGTSTVAQLATSMANLREVHEFYPVLCYFRFTTPCYAISRMTLLSLDAVSLIRSALETEENRWVAESGSITQLWNASMTLLKRLQSTFVPGEPGPAPESEGEERKWRERYAEAVEALRAAGIRTRGMDAVQAYIEQRSKWQPHIEELAQYLQFTMADVDPVMQRQPAHEPVESRA